MSWRSCSGKADELGVHVRENRCDAVQEPVHLARAAQKDAAQHAAGHALGMRLRVGQRERRAPGAAEQQPAVDAQMAAQPLDILDQIGVVLSSRPPSGRDRPAPRWSKMTMRQNAGSKNRRCTAPAPAPGPPCRNSTGKPRGLPACSQYITWEVESGR